MLVLVASTGAAVSIACDAAASVGAVGDALAAHPDVAVPRRDQLLIFDGRRLEGETRTLAEYGLPERAGDFLETTRSLSEPLLSQRNVSPGDAPSSGAPGAPGAKEPRSIDEKNENENETPPVVQYVFLYRKSALRSERASSAAETPSETLFTEGEKKESKESASAVAIEPTPPPPRSDGSHPLERAAVRLFVHREQHESGTESVSSRLHRLVALERSLAHAGARVQRDGAASAARLRRAEALVRATRVRALAADAASASAETPGIDAGCARRSSQCACANARVVRLICWRRSRMTWRRSARRRSRLRYYRLRVLLRRVPMNHAPRVVRCWTWWT